MIRIKYILIVIIFTFSFSKTYSEIENEQIIFGAKAGINLSTLNGQGAYLVVNGSRLDASSKINAVAGITAEYSFSDQFAIQPELLLSMKGVNFDANEFVHSWSLWYLEMPVLFKSVFEMDNDVLGSFYAGPAIAYKLKSTWSEKYLDSYLHEDEDMYGINDLDYSAVVGASFDMEMLGSRIGLDLRYTYGLQSIQNDVSAQNGTISIMLYYLIGAMDL
ncbi:MAG: porin family protein [bacterium]